MTTSDDLPPPALNDGEPELDVVSLTPDTSAWEAASPASKAAAREGFVKEFGLPADAKASDVIQHIMRESGHQITFGNLLATAFMMGADIQLFVYNNESTDAKD